MLILRGLPAFSESRITQLETDLKPDLPTLKQANVEHFYVVHTREDLSDAEQSTLLSLLNVHEDTLLPQPKGRMLMVVPRLGCQSPWSSKAMDIVHHAGLKKVERIERGRVYYFSLDEGVIHNAQKLRSLGPKVSDRMTESVVLATKELKAMFEPLTPEAMAHIDVMTGGIDALQEANENLALGLNDAELQYLLKSYRSLERDPTDVELMMFAQANSEHCRHKLFNAEWTINDEVQSHSLFKMVKNTYQQNPVGVLSAYSDNAAVIAGAHTGKFYPDPHTHEYGYQQTSVHILMKVETHNHPTGISPYPGAATGSGGEIRDEGATGRGAKPKAGLVGYAVSDLHIPERPLPWEEAMPRNKALATPLHIMRVAPIGAANYNNEFGRPAICGFFRTFSHIGLKDNKQIRWGYDKPIMIAGGYGNVSEEHVSKISFPDKTVLVVLGGPAMRIGLGGGAASSQSTGTNSKDLDYASVQRDNAEMQRRCQEVIDYCNTLGHSSPILSIHDVGAGGLANALPELLHDAGLGGEIDLNLVPNAEPGMSPLVLWCNESQERYVLAVEPAQLDAFETACARERCPYAIVGHATREPVLKVKNLKPAEGSLTEADAYAVDLPMSVLFGSLSAQQRKINGETSIDTSELDLPELDLSDAAMRVLSLPTVADKSFLINIGDRSIGGLVARDQMVGPWQEPVADVGVTAQSFESYVGEAMAMGERTPLALINPAASARMAVAESITNIAAAHIEKISDIKLSGNWMVDSSRDSENYALWQAVSAACMSLCPQLGIAIPVGKDSTSMRVNWKERRAQHSVSSPLSLIISAFAPVIDIRNTLTPELQDEEDTELWLIDLGRGQQRMGGSAVAYVYNQLGDEAPDLDDPELLLSFFAAIQDLKRASLLLAYHDRSDGGMFTTVCEMAFAGRLGLHLNFQSMGVDPFAILFNEELGAVIQVRKQDAELVREILAQYHLAEHTHVVGVPKSLATVTVQIEGCTIFEEDWATLHRAWSETSYHIQKLRAAPQCAESELAYRLDPKNTGLFVDLKFDQQEELLTPNILKHKPQVAILREQGVNGHIEMAAAFDTAGFTAVDVHMTDLLNGHIDLSSFQGLVACGGFSYGDVLGAGSGWAKEILLHHELRESFKNFFHREDTFTLGVCNGCQMLSQLKILIPGAELWPSFVRNTSEQFEARLSQVVIPESPSIFFKDMTGSVLPVAVAHGEGRVSFSQPEAPQLLQDQSLVAMQYVDYQGKPTETYPANPNGSPSGITGVTTTDGRVTLLMPHPERVFRSVQWSWCPKAWQKKDSPWLRMFENARLFVL